VTITWPPCSRGSNSSTASAASRVSALINDLRRWGASKLTAVNRVVSQPRIRKRRQV
jgi:hypothetical protein